MCVLAPGLGDAEFDRIEAEYGVVFAEDHRAFLAAGLPVARAEPPEEGESPRNPWPDWRDGDPARLRERLEWPVEGLLFSVRNGWWLPGGEWGPRPADPAEAVAVARDALASVPRLVPVHAHRYLPPRTTAAYGAPVLSVHGSDVIHYGRDLEAWVGHEFAHPAGDAPSEPWEEPAAEDRVPFWSGLVV